MCPCATSCIAVGKARCTRFQNPRFRRQRVHPTQAARSAVKFTESAPSEPERTNPAHEIMGAQKTQKDQIRSTKTWVSNNLRFRRQRVHPTQAARSAVRFTESAPNEPERTNPAHEIMGVQETQKDQIRPARTWVSNDTQQCKNRSQPPAALDLCNLANSSLAANVGCDDR
jgi:hypothetical protein